MLSKSADLGLLVGGSYILVSPCGNGLFTVEHRKLRSTKNALYINFCMEFMFNEGSSNVLTIHLIDTRICMVSKIIALLSICCGQLWV